METSVSLLERLAGAHSDDDWRLLDLYQPLLHTLMARGGSAATPFPPCWLGGRRHNFRSLRGEDAFVALLRCAVDFFQDQLARFSSLSPTEGSTISPFCPVLKGRGVGVSGGLRGHVQGAMALPRTGLRGLALPPCRFSADVSEPLAVKDDRGRQGVGLLLQIPGGNSLQPARRGGKLQRRKVGWPLNPHSGEPDRGSVQQGFMPSAPSRAARSFASLRCIFVTLWRRRSPHGPLVVSGRESKT